MSLRSMFVGRPRGRGGPLTRLQDASAGVGKVLLQRLFNLEPEQGASKVPCLITCTASWLPCNGSTQYAAVLGRFAYRLASYRWRPHTHVASSGRSSVSKGSCSLLQKVSQYRGSSHPPPLVHLVHLAHSSPSLCPTNFQLRPPLLVWFTPSPWIIAASLPACVQDPTLLHSPNSCSHATHRAPHTSTSATTKISISSPLDNDWGRSERRARVGLICQHDHE